MMFPQYLDLQTAHNLDSLGLYPEFKIIGDLAYAEFCFTEQHQGLPGFVREGIIALLLDEAMGWLARHVAGVKSVTAKMDIHFNEPIRTMEKLIIRAQITKQHKKTLEEIACIEREDGTLLTHATCLQYAMSSKITLDELSCK
jgi:acyl-coenzyme A thioesterase PaaI-like protein